MASFTRRPPPTTVVTDQDATMLQYLINKYGGETIITMVEQNLSTNHLPINYSTFGNGSTSRDLSPRTSYSSVHSALSTFSNGTTASSATSVSDANSSIRGSMHSDFSMPERPSPIICQQPNPGHSNSSQKGSLQARAAANNAVNALHASNALHAGQKRHACPFCEEYGINLTCGRKSDLKKHLLDFHNHDTVWHCPSGECGLIFDVKSAFETHVKKIHSNMSVQTDSATMRTCSQVVFACGFADCKFLLEAENDATAKDTAHKFLGHVANHFDDHGHGAGSKWSYTTRFRNLMRQPLVDKAWKNRQKGYPQHGWQLQTSTILRKMLETRHVLDVHQFVQYAAFLENIPGDELSQAHFPPELFVPTPDTCPQAAHGHGSEPEEKWPHGNERLTSPAMSHPNTRPATPAQFNNQSLILESQAHLMPSPSHSTVTSPAESTMIPEFPQPPVTQPPQIRCIPPSAEPHVSPTPSRRAGASFASRAAQQHPLALFTGFSATRDSQLPQGATVIADLARRMEENRPMTAADLAALHLQQDLPQRHQQRNQQQHQLAPAYGGTGDMDVDMSGYAPGPFFNYL